MSSPPVGSMYLYDDITPPLLDNSYQLSVVTNVTFDGTQQALQPATGFFNIGGPRFSLSATEVGAVFPPNNGHGGFDEAIPHVALIRRTLPWERALTSKPSLIGAPTQAAGDPPQPNPIPPQNNQPQTYGPTPWIALLLFEEGEYQINHNVPLQNAVPADVYQRLDPPASIACDTVQASLGLVNSLMPSLEELTLLAHVRQVNVDDKELNSGSTDGWFSVVMSNRVPAPGAKYRACLVSLEERTDLVAANPPPVAQPILVGTILGEDGFAARTASAPIEGISDQAATTILVNADERRITSSVYQVASPVFQYLFATVQLVLLYSWQFECTGVGTFRDYMQRINVSMTGTVEDPGHPEVSDTGHIQMTLADRVGVDEDVWYRGPLVAFPLTRDPLTYHSADQCRRVSPETGAEDISYSAAFEAGRLLAASDARLAQELMRWRREAYRQSARVDCLTAIQTAMSLPQALDVHAPVATTIAANAAQSIVNGISKLGDRYGLSNVANVAGLNPSLVQQAWNLGSVNDAAAILGADAGATGAEVAAPAQSARSATTLAAVAADSASLQNLSNARLKIIANTETQLENV